MLDAAEIRKEIARLEYEESDYKNYAKLADLYVIRKQMQEEERGDGGKYVGYYSGAPAPVTAEPAIKARRPPICRKPSEGRAAKPHPQRILQNISAWGLSILIG